jgi:hypothetical protein
MYPVFQMGTDGTFHQKILVEKLQGFPNDTIIPDLEEIVDLCVRTNEGRYKKNKVHSTEVQLTC